MIEQVVRGPLLVPNVGDSVTFHADGTLAADPNGVLQFAGPWAAINGQLPKGLPVRQSSGVMLPPLVDIHTHIPQHPIRGRFVEGIPDDAPGGKLLAGLQRNVFPREAKCREPEVAEQVVRAFLADTLAHGVVGGAAYMTPSAEATEIALSILPKEWSVGLVLMNQNCPANLRSDEGTVDADVARLATRFGKRLIVTDRFAVAVSTPLRKRASTLASRYGLRTQTHLNEQVGEKDFVERTLYPGAASYADVYLQDGLLDHDCIAAHCIQMTGAEWSILSDRGVTIAHCPTSNLLLGSGVMSLDQVIDRGIPYAIATDVGASPTVSMLAEMKRFIDVHRGRSSKATASEALFRASLAPAELLGLHDVGRLEPGRAMSFIEVAAELPADPTPERVIAAMLPADADRPALSVRRVTLRGKVLVVS
jgi:guanine deaminase